MSTRIFILKNGVITPTKTASDRQLTLNSLVSTMTANRVLRSDGTNIVLSQIDLSTDIITGILPPANGGSGSSASYVDLSSNQTINGVKTFSGSLQLPNNSGTSAGTIWRSGDALQYKDGANITKTILNSAGNLSNLADKQVSLNNLVGTQVANRVLRSNGTNVTLSQVALDTDVINTLPISSGGTGSNTQNFVDITTDQEVGGTKRFLSPILIGLNSDLSVRSYTDSNIKFVSSAAVTSINHCTGSLTIGTNPANTFGFLTTDTDINASTTINITSIISGGHFRIRNFGTGTITTLQGLRLTAQNNSTGTVTNLDGAFFNARNDGVGSTVGILNGGNFNASLIVASTATTINAGNFTASAVSASTATTVRGINITVSSSNTTPATNCIGIDIANITGTATNKFAIRTGTGRVFIGDTTATTSTTTGSLVTGGGAAFGGTIAANFPTSSAGLSAGTVWRNGNVLNVV